MIMEKQWQNMSCINLLALANTTMRNGNDNVSSFVEANRDMEKVDSKQTNLNETPSNRQIIPTKVC